jgi:SAM-dependent methyltransferase
MRAAHDRYGMIAWVSGIYDEPELYELACAYRDIPAEVTALQAWCAAHHAGHVRSVLELAAGPAEHARELARRGVRATALDRSPAMCGYAAAQAKSAGVALDVIEGDMRDFLIADSGGRPVPFDLAVTMLNSLCHLFTLDDLVRHLTAVRAQLAPGGLYIAELAHPADFFAAEPRTSNEWVIDADGVRADVHWGGKGDRIDPLTQVTREHMSITATAKDGTIRTVSDVVPNRFWTLTEFTAAVALANTVLANAGLASPGPTGTGPTGTGPAGGPGPGSGGFDLVATYGDFDAATPLDAPAAWRMILILQAAGSR